MWRRPTIVAPLIVTVILAGVTTVAVWNSVNANEGHLVFSLDDPYIHLAMAKSLAQHGVWGVTSYSFSATSSAPLYTLLLALAFTVTGPTEFWAWFFCIAGGLIVAAMLAARAARFFPRPLVAILIGLWVVVITGLPEMMFTGMEHSLHMVMVIVLAILTERRLAGGRGWERGDWALAGTMLIAAALRYETLFLLPPVLWSFFRAGRKTTAFAVAIAAILPATVLGIVQLAHGAMILPNTILLKGVFYEHHGLWSYVLRFGRQIDTQYWIVFLGLATIAIFTAVRRGDLKDRRLAGLFLLVFGILCQSAFALPERRYLGYLVALAVWVLLPWIGEWVGALRATVKSRALALSAAAVVVSVGVLPFAGRVGDLARLRHLSRDIYEQQYQMARFFSTYYKGQVVALNDIGLVSWFGENRILDLWGLANERVARWRMSNEYGPALIRQITASDSAAVAALYAGWFVTHGGLPDEWRPAGHWQITMATKSNVGSPLVFFFPIRPEDAESLQRNLQDFAPQLPRGVKVGY